MLETVNKPVFYIVYFQEKYTQIHSITPISFTFIAFIFKNYCFSSVASYNLTRDCSVLMSIILKFWYITDLSLHT